MQSSASKRRLGERAARYRELASKAAAAAERSQADGLRAGWHKIAVDWTELALEVERGLTALDASAVAIERT